MTRASSTSVSDPTVPRKSPRHRRKDSSQQNPISWRLSACRSLGPIVPSPLPRDIGCCFSRGLVHAERQIRHYRFGVTRVAIGRSISSSEKAILPGPVLQASTTWPVGEEYITSSDARDRISGPGSQAHDRACGVSGDHSGDRRDWIAAWSGVADKYSRSRPPSATSDKSVKPRRAACPSCRMYSNSIGAPQVTQTAPWRSTVPGRGVPPR